MKNPSIYNYLDNYCERAGGGALFAEPLNLLTNLAFLIAAWYAYRRFKDAPSCNWRNGWNILLLIIILASIGIGSGLWHLIPQRWTMLADVLPILLFINLYLLSFLVQIMRCRWWWVVLCWLGYQGLVYATGVFFLPDTLGGTIMYMPTYITLIMMAVYLKVGGNPFFRLIALVLVIWTVSLVLRTLDMTLCSMIPFGTHFFWHLLNAVVLYLLLHGLIVQKR